MQRIKWDGDFHGGAKTLQSLFCWKVVCNIQHYPIYPDCQYVAVLVLLEGRMQRMGVYIDQIRLYAVAVLVLLEGRMQR